MTLIELNKELNCWEKFLDSFVKILKRSVKIGDFCIEILIKQNIEDVKQKINGLLVEWRKAFPENQSDITNLPTNVFMDLMASIARSPERIVGNEVKLASLFIFCLQFQFKMELGYMGHFKKILLSNEMKSGLKDPKNNHFYENFVSQISQAKKDGKGCYNKSCYDLLAVLCSKYK